MYAGYEGHPVSSLYVGRGKNVDEKQEGQVDDFWQITSDKSWKMTLNQF